MTWKDMATPVGMEEKHNGREQSGITVLRNNMDSNL